MSGETRPSVRSRRRLDRLPEMDWPLLICVLLLLGFGFIMVASSSMSIADRGFGDPFHFVLRHGLALGLALAAGLLVFLIPANWWEKSGALLFFLGIALLIAVLVPGVGRTVNGATRWIPSGRSTSKARS